MQLFKKRSLSFKLVLLFLLAGFTMTLVMHFSTGKVLREYFQDSIHGHLHQYFQQINTQIGTPPDLEVAQRLSSQLNVKIIIRGPEMHWSSDGSFIERPRVHFRQHQHPSGQYESSIHKGRFVIRMSNPPYRIAFVAKGDSNLPSVWKLLLNTLLGFFLVLTLLYLFLRWMISPIKQIQQSVKRIGSGELDHRITIKQKDELGELSVEVNAMADDINNMLEAKQQLLLAISHELRSPLTRAKVALSLMHEGALKEGLDDDINEMESLISDLLEAERLNHRHQTLNLSKVAINQLIIDTLEKQYPDQPIQPQLDNSLTIQTLDESRFQFVIKNLLDNALKHTERLSKELSEGLNKEQSKKIIIKTKQLENQWQLVIEDQGRGIPEKHIPHLTEPFYRVDPSRQRETGGYGLGLYIIKMIVEAHQGQLTIESVEKVKTSVIITIPN